VTGFGGLYLEANQVLRQKQGCGGIDKNFPQAACIGTGTPSFLVVDVESVVHTPRLFTEWITSLPDVSVIELHRRILVA
jgi:hypothetical protein